MLSDKDVIMTRPNPRCQICGSAGVVIYGSLQDVIFGAHGGWGFKKCVNSNCEHIWLDPIPLESEIGKAYKKYYTHEGYRKVANRNNVNLLRTIYNILKINYLSYRYDYTVSKTQFSKTLGRLIYLLPPQRAYLDFSVFFLRANPSGRLLEIGCGSGVTLSRMAELGWVVEGVDFDPSAVVNAKSKGLTVALGTLEQQQYVENFFDAIVMSHLFEHVHDPLRLLQESHRILKTGGKLVIVTPNCNSLCHKLLGQRWRGLEPPRHLNIFSIKSLTALARRSGFSNLSVSSSIRNADGIYIASIMHQRGTGWIEGTKVSLGLRVWACCIQYVEWFLLLFKRDSGEELTLIAEK